LQQQLFGALTGQAVANIEIHLTDVANRNSVLISGVDGTPPSTCYIFNTGETISGEVKILVLGGKKLESLGVKLELRGEVEVYG
jgi:Vacuolar protein sorting-associated protein 26